MKLNLLYFFTHYKKHAKFKSNDFFKKLLLNIGVLFFFLIFISNSFAQTTRTVGAGGDYTTLKGAFDAINAGSITGNITLQITSNTTETATAELNASGVGSANYNSVLIYPTAAGLTISGTFAAPLINLNGADNITIDGRVNQTGSTKSLTISNTNVVGSAIQFINDASNNAIRYSIIQGVNTSLTSGLIVFSTGAITGNDNNTIEFCDIRDGATTPTNAIYSAGTSVAIDNSGNTVLGNNIQDYFNAAAASKGILIASNSSAWTISNNRFYQTATRTATVGATHHAINIITASGGNYTVNNNIIGYADALGTGTTTYDGAFAHQYRAIELTVDASPVSNVQGNTIAGISFSTTSGSVVLPGIFSGISILGGTVNIGTTTGNTIGATTGTDSIVITSTTTLGVITGIYATSSSTVSIQNNNIGAISTGGTAAIGYTFHGINTAGGGQFTVSGNTIGSTTTANSINVGTSGVTTTGVCTFNGINNAATGLISITGNTIQNCSAFGTAASVFNGILNSGGAGTLNITGNNVIAANNTGTGALTGISNSAIVASLNINTNIIRNLTKTVAAGAVTAISNTGIVTSAININNNQLGNADGGLISYTVANSGALTGISNTAGAASAALTIQENDIRGIVHTVAGSSVHNYITNTAATLTQNISSNTFTNLAVNTTGNVTFLTLSNSLFASGVQTVNSNSIVTAFSKTGAGGTVTFCNGTGAASQPGSVITQNGNNFSNVTVTGATAISGWINSNTSLNKTFSANTFSNWTGGSAALTVMTITTGKSNIADNVISNMTTGTAAAAPIIAISSGATDAISITGNNISNLVTASAAFANSFTGITNNAGTDVTITGNTITGCTAGGTGISLFTGITAITAGSGTLTITGNNIISGTNAGTGAFTAISNATTFATANISSNIIRNNSITSATGTFTAISNTGAVTTNININNNQLGNATGGLVTYTAANSGALIGINNNGGTISSALSIQNNDIRGITHNVAGTSPHTYILNSAATLSQNISNNTFTNLSVNTTGAIIFISNSVIMPANGVQNVNSNSIATGFTRTAASGDITLFTSVASTSNTNVTVNNNSNNFSGITISGTATISGWVNTDAGLGNASKTIDGNTFSNWTTGTGTGTITVMNVNITSTNNAIKNNNINTISSAGNITGITTAAGNDNIFSNTIHTLISAGTVATTVNGIAITGGTVKNVYQNTIYNLQANNITTGSVSGISVSGGLTNNVYRNKIYNLSSSSSGITGTVNGILVSGAIANQITTIHNNRIGDLRASAANVADPIRGISVANTGTTSRTNVYYNTIFLNATSSGATFGSTGIFHAASATATIGAMDLRNNIIVNNSTPNGAGITAAFRRNANTAGTLANYASTSNNNLFFAGTPGANRVIYTDGTNSPQTLVAYKAGAWTAGTITPRDQASVTESPTFISTNGADATYLHINTSSATQIESGAVNISGITTDFDGDIRQGNAGYTGASTTAPDIGADEGNFGLATDVNPPSITYSLITSNSCLTTQELTATITDASGVNTTAGTKPRIYFKRSTDPNTFTGWKFTEATNSGSPFNFTIDYSLLGGVSAGQTIQYFVVAQDLASTPNVAIHTGAFAATPASVALTATAFPIGGTIQSYTLLAGLSGTVTIGTGSTYTTLTGAGGLFAAINTNGLSGNLVANIISTSITETGANALNQINYGCGSNYTVTIKPNADVAATLTGSVAGAMINLNGADFVTFDGLNTGGSSLIIQNINTGALATTIQFIGDAVNNTITNCTIEGSTTGAALGTIMFSTGISTGNDGNTISNNTIKEAGVNLPINAIYSAGTSVAIDNSGNSITGNNIQDYFNAAAASKGILIASNSSAWTISNNRFYQTATRTVTVGATHHAINIITASGGNYTVNNNIIGYADALGTGTTTYDGAFAHQYRAIELTVGASPASNVQGNTVSGINLSTTSLLTTAPGIFTGISVLAGSVNVGTTAANTIGATTGTGAITITSTTSATGYIAGIYAISANVVTIQNNHIGSINIAGGGVSPEARGYTFHGINTAGGGQFTISGNTIGSTTTANSINVGTSGTTTTGVCTFNGVNNAATGLISITGNTIENCTGYGTGLSVFNGILNTGGAGTLNITGNNVIAANNTGTGALTGISNSAIVASLNINTNIIRNLTKTVAAGAVTAISNTAAVTSTININNNQLGNADGGLISYTVANSGALTGISNTAGSASAALTIQENDIRGIVHTVAGSSVHNYITNTAATLTQNISSNTFTNLAVNTTGNVTFLTLSNSLFASGVQTVNSNSIVTAFSKTGAGGTVTFCNGTGAASQPGSVITQNLNNFSNVTVTGATAISGWINSNTSLNKTFSANTFSNWTGGSAALTVMTITTGKSTITDNIISNMTTGTAAAAPIIAISSGATDAISITGNNISNLVTASAAFANSFTGITNNAGTDVTITGNTITGCTAGGTGASIFTGITALTAGSGTLTITENNIISGTNAGTGAFNAISNATTFATANISSNIIRSNSITSAAGPFTAISNTGAVTTNININNNQLGNASGGLVTYTAANTAALIGINNTGGTISSALSIQNNDIRGITHNVAGTSPHTYIINSAATLSQNISSNTFTNLSVNTTGAIIFISNSVAMPANGVQNVNSNSIATGFTRTAASGALTLFTSTASTNNTGITVENNSNNFSGITISGTATIAGWVNTDAGLGNVTKTIDGNTFSNWTGGTGVITAMNVNITSPNNAIRNNIINTISSAGNITGITTAAGNDHIFSNIIHTLISAGTVATTVNGIAITGGTVKNVYQNTIYNLQANNITTGSVSGIAVSGGLTNNVYRNKIYNLSSSSSGITGTVNGILVSGAIANQITTIHNNRIGDLRATAANVADPIRGISVANTGTTSRTNVYYNTVYLNATSSGALFGSSGIYHLASTTSTTGALNLRNNIIANVSTPNGIGLTVAYRRNLGTVNTLNNYVSTSNNNLFYAGIPGANNLIYTDGTSTAETLTLYKIGMFTAGTISPRDQASVTENPTFISTTGADATFLKINTSVTTLIESGSLNISGFTDDFDGDIRQENTGYTGFGTNPDIGADEFEGIMINLWKGNINENWSIVGNWTRNFVPITDASIIFDDLPLNHLVMDQDRSVTNITNNQSTFRLVLNGNKLTLKGNTNFTNGATIDASGINSIMVFAGTTTQTIPSGMFFNNNVFNLNVNNSNNVLLNGSLRLLNALNTAVGRLDASTSLPTIIYAGTNLQSIESNQFLTERVHNLTIDNGAGVNINTNFNIINTLQINTDKKLNVSSVNQLTALGTITNNGGNAGLVLKSDANGTASLLHNTNNVAATVQRYISRNAEDWHFLSSPVSDQAINGDWLPTGTYGTNINNPIGTGYDLYVWNETTFCWIYKSDSVNWPLTHPTTNFVTGRGYLYSVQATKPTKTFEGNLNNGTINYPITKSTTTDATLKELEGYNLVGNPYPSSIDWSATTGWTRSNLATSAGGYDMWIWNPAANNYGVYNSATQIGSNEITRFIAPMQGYFVKAVSNGNLSIVNSVRVHTGAGNWFRTMNINTGIIRASVLSDAKIGSDEVILQFGYSKTQLGASKIFSHVLKAPSLYFNTAKKPHAVQYFTNTIDNPSISLAFKAGADGYYTLKLDFNSTEFEFVQLEDLIIKTKQTIISGENYRFKATVKDTDKRFVIHFAPKDTITNELNAKIYTDGVQLFVDLSLINNPTEIVVYDILGKLLLKKTLQGATLHALDINSAKQVLIVRLLNESGRLNKKIFFIEIPK